MSTDVKGAFEEMNILVLVHSRTGNALELARAVADGARLVPGADVRLKRVPEIEAEDALRNNPWFGTVFAEQVAPVPVASLDDLKWAHGIIMGCGTRSGAVSAELKRFIDQAGGLWLEGTLVGKVGAAFATAATPHGGLEMTVHSLLVPMMHLGMIIVSPGYGDPVMHEAGSPYGAVARAGGQALMRPTDKDLAAARFLGRRVAEVASRLFPVTSPRPAGTAAAP